MCLYFFHVFIMHEMTHVQHFCLPGFARASVHVADTQLRAFKFNIVARSVNSSNGVAVIARQPILGGT